MLAVLGCADGAIEPGQRPNVLVIVADDLGYSDLGVLGGEIPTPNIDALAAGGVLLTNFHVAATCSPTRAMLLSGVDNHRAGLGNMGEFLTEAQRGQPGYEGHLNHRVRTLAERLRDVGYATMMAGKWHLGGEPAERPHARGFDRTFAFLEGSGSAWSDRSPAPLLGDHVRFTRDGEVVPRPEGFAASLYVDEVIGFLDDLETSGADAATRRPFFAYLAFQSVHWPHHAPKRFLDAARGRYDGGWRAVRDARLARQRELDLLPASASAAPLESAVPEWASLPESRRRDEIARMEAYAAMTMAMDFEVGRLVEHLRANGRLDDALILFVSDNGADPSEPERGDQARAWYERLYPKTEPATFGEPGSFPSTGFAWARVSVTPLAGTKGQPFEGGLRVPLVAHHPSRIASGSRNGIFGYATDLVPTVLEAVGLEPKDEAHPDALPIEGRSLWSVLLGAPGPRRAVDETVGYELMGNVALFRGSSKLVRRHGSPWQLFDLDTDPGETRDLAETRPERLALMLEEYARYERRAGVIPVPDDYDVMRILRGHGR